MDIVELILMGHEQVLRLHAALADEFRGGRGRNLASAWDDLADLTEATMDMEEEVWYPALFGASQVMERIGETIAAHYGIRGAIAEARRLRPADSPPWRRAVKDALSGCFEHFDEEERLLLSAFRAVPPRPAPIAGLDAG